MKKIKKSKLKEKPYRTSNVTYYTPEGEVKIKYKVVEMIPYGTVEVPVITYGKKKKKKSKEKKHG